MKILNNRGTGIIEAFIIAGIFAFLCWFTDASTWDKEPKEDQKQDLDQQKR